MNDKNNKIFTFSWKDTLLSLILLMIPFGLCYLIQIYIEDSAIYSSLLFLFSIFLISRFTNGYLYGIVSSIIASFIVNYAFTIPYFEHQAMNLTADISNLKNDTGFDCKYAFEDGIRDLIKSL